MNLEASIISAIHEVAEARGLDMPPPQPTHTLTGDLGLRSLDLAHLIAILEAELKLDPFARLVPITSIRTVGDLVHAYRRSMTESAASAATAPEVDEAVHRARTRRAAVERYRDSA